MKLLCTDNGGSRMFTTDYLYPARPHYSGSLVEVTDDLGRVRALSPGPDGVARFTVDYRRFRDGRETAVFAYFRVTPS